MLRIVFHVKHCLISECDYYIIKMDLNGSVNEKDTIKIEGGIHG